MNMLNFLILIFVVAAAATEKEDPNLLADCHEYVYVGGPNFEFWDSMGYMKKQGSKNTYKQMSGGHILQYKPGTGWAVTVSEDGDILAYCEDEARCAYEASCTWWYLDHGEWLADIDLRARLSPEEKCSTDGDCAGCFYVSYDGHDYCCASQCTWGWIDHYWDSCICGH